MGLCPDSAAADRKRWIALLAENIVVRNDGLAKLLDFGLARLHCDLSIDSEKTMPGALLGTVPYMSPEQARAEEVASSSDIFSLGIVFYELLTGRHPFNRSNVGATLEAIELTQPEPVHRINPAIGKQVSDLIQRMLEKLPQRRPTALNVVISLEQTTSGPTDLLAWATELPAAAPHFVVGREQDRFANDRIGGAV